MEKEKRKERGEVQKEPQTPMKPDFSSEEDGYAGKNKRRKRKSEKAQKRRIEAVSLKLETSRAMTRVHPT